VLHIFAGQLLELRDIRNQSTETAAERDRQKEEAKTKEEEKRTGG